MRNPTFIRLAREFESLAVQIAKCFRDDLAEKRSREVTIPKSIADISFALDQVPMIVRSMITQAEGGAPVDIASLRRLFDDYTTTINRILAAIQASLKVN